MKKERPIWMQLGTGNCSYKTVGALPSFVADWELPYTKGTFQRHVGVEIEVENTVDIKPQGWIVERDGSLRGDTAREYKSKFPCTCLDAFERLDDIYSRINAVREKKGKGMFDFNERTSIHVHVDVRDLSINQAKSAIKLYMIFEKSFFDLVGRERLHNIFCIPVSESNVFNRNRGREWWQQWDKYCALNAQPVAGFGTLEFRQMMGNDNVRLIKSWVLLLASLVEYAKNTSPQAIDEEINTLKVESQYMHLARRIFGPVLADTLTIFPEEADCAATATKLF